MRRRLRPAYTPQQLEALYATPHDHRVQAEGDDHELRVAKTLEMIEEVGPVDAAADLSCGNGVLLDAVVARRKFYGDFAPGWPITGPLEKTLDQIPAVDLFLCCETVEHLDDPDRALTKIRQRARCLILSTPFGERNSRNPEHYWGWDDAGVRKMLWGAGWQPVRFELTYPKVGYVFQIWRCA